MLVLKISRVRFLGVPSGRRVVRGLAGFTLKRRSLSVGGMTIVKCTDAEAEQRTLAQVTPPACTRGEVTALLAPQRERTMASTHRRIRSPWRVSLHAFPAIRYKLPVRYRLSFAALS